MARQKKFTPGELEMLAKGRRRLAPQTSKVLAATNTVAFIPESATPTVQTQPSAPQQVADFESVLGELEAPVIPSQTPAPSPLPITPVAEAIAQRGQDVDAIRKQALQEALALPERRAKQQAQGELAEERKAAGTFLGGADSPVGNDRWERLRSIPSIDDPIGSTRQDPREMLSAKAVEEALASFPVPKGAEGEVDTQAGRVFNFLHADQKMDFTAAHAGAKILSGEYQPPRGSQRTEADDVIEAYLKAGGTTELGGLTSGAEENRKLLEDVAAQVGDERDRQEQEAQEAAAASAPQGAESSAEIRRPPTARELIQMNTAEKTLAQARANEKLAAETEAIRQDTAQKRLLQPGAVAKSLADARTARAAADVKEKESRLFLNQADSVHYKELAAEQDALEAKTEHTKEDTKRIKALTGEIARAAEVNSIKSQQAKATLNNTKTRTAELKSEIAKKKSTTAKGRRDTAQAQIKIIQDQLADEAWEVGKDEVLSSKTQDWLDALKEELGDPSMSNEKLLTSSVWEKSYAASDLDATDPSRTETPEGRLAAAKETGFKPGDETDRVLNGKKIRIKLNKEGIWEKVGDLVSGKDAGGEEATKSKEATEPSGKADAKPAEKGDVFITGPGKEGTIGKKEYVDALAKAKSTGSAVDIGNASVYPSGRTLWYITGKGVYILDREGRKFFRKNYNDDDVEGWPE